jgi:hypothetical protein
MANKEPEGIAFFNIKSGDTHYAKLEPQIQAYINSSDMGINASRNQDYGWRLAPEWVKAVKAFRRDNSKMAVLASRNDGRKVTTTQILYYLYGEQIRNYKDIAEEEANPFEEKYLQDISSNSKPAVQIPTLTVDAETPKVSSKKQ